MVASRLALLAVPTALACQPAARDELTAEHAAAIADSAREVLAKYGELMRAGRWESAVSYYADDPRFQWWEDGKLAYSSVEEISTAIRSLQAMFQSSEMELSDTRIGPLAPGVVAVNSLYKQTPTDTAGGAFSFGGAISITAVNTESGWKFLMGHTSTERARSQ